MTDRFQKKIPQIDGPVSSGFQIEPSDVDLPSVTRAIYVGGAGNITITLAGYRGEGSLDLTFVGVTAGTILPVRAIKVKAEGTTATELLGLY